MGVNPTTKTPLAPSLPRQPRRTIRGPAHHLTLARTSRRTRNPLSVQEDTMNAPTSNSRLWHWLGGMGIVFSILFLLANVFLGSSPSEKASPVKIVNYYSAHKTSVTAGVFVVVFAALAFSFFLCALRRTLAGAKTDSGYL